MHIHLHRLQISNFKGLEQTDLNFPSDLVPRVYPIAGANGSGKSLVLELIFCLLTCLQPARQIYLQNLLGDLGRQPSFDTDDTIARIELDFDGRLLDLHYYAIPFRNLSERDLVRLVNPTNFTRFQSELVESEVYPIYYLPDRYLLLCGFGWREPRSEVATIDLTEFARIFNEIGRRVFLAANVSQIPHFLYSPDLTPDTYRQQLKQLPETLGCFLNLDRVLGWWQLSPRPELFALKQFLENTYAATDGSIVLLDGFDLGMDADNQYAVVGDLLAISDKNQYLLATNSFELCQALTPAHVVGI